MSDSIAYRWAPEFLSVKELFDTPDQPIDWIVDGIIPSVGVVMLGGEAYVGKSRLVNAIVCARTNARLGLSSQFPIPVKPGRTLLASLEHSKPSVKRELAQACKVEGLDGSQLDLTIMRPTFNILDPSHVDELLERCEQELIDLLFLDSFRRLGAFDEDKSKEIKFVMENLHRLTGEGRGPGKQRAVVALHHLTKSSKQLRGSGDLKAGSDTMVMLHKAGTSITLTATHHDWEEVSHNLRILKDGSWAFAPSSTVEATAENAHIFDGIRARGPSTLGEIQQYLKGVGQIISQEDLRYQLDDFVQSGQLLAKGSSKSQRWSLGD